MSTPFPQRPTGDMQFDFSGDSTDVVEYVTSKCAWCDQSSLVLLPADRVRRWQTTGAYVQVMFPELTPDQRELLISGTHPACWDVMFAEVEDEEEPSQSG